jgi:hypothetical protein
MRARQDARQPARQSKAHPDCRSATIKSRVKKISLALSPGRDNHPPAATAKMAILIVAVFPSRLSRYTRVDTVHGAITEPVRRLEVFSGDGLRRNGGVRSSPDIVAKVENRTIQKISPKRIFRRLNRCNAL